MQIKCLGFKLFQTLLLEVVQITDLLKSDLISSVSVNCIQKYFQKTEESLRVT